MKERYVTYDRADGPWGGETPSFSVFDVGHDLPSAAKGGLTHSIGTPAPIFRPHTSKEMVPDLIHPHFSNCTVPVVFYLHFMNNAHGEMVGSV